MRAAGPVELIRNGNGKRPAGSLPPPPRASSRIIDSDDDDFEETSIVPANNEVVHRATPLQDTTVPRGNAATHFRKNVDQEMALAIRTGEDMAKLSDAVQRHSHLVDQAIEHGRQAMHDSCRDKINYGIAQVEQLKSACPGDHELVNAFVDVIKQSASPQQMAIQFTQDYKGQFGEKKGIYTDFDYRINGDTTDVMGKSVVRLIRFIEHIYPTVNAMAMLYTTKSIPAIKKEMDDARTRWEAELKAKDCTPAKKAEYEEAKAALVEQLKLLETVQATAVRALMEAGVTSLKTDLKRLEQMCEPTAEAKRLEGLFKEKQKLYDEEVMKVGVIEFVFGKMLHQACRDYKISDKWFCKQAVPMIQAPTKHGCVKFAAAHAVLVMKQVIADSMVPSDWVNKVPYNAKRERGEKWENCMLQMCDTRELLDRHKELQFFKSQLATRSVRPRAAAYSSAPAPAAAASSSAPRPAPLDGGVSSFIRR